MPQQYAWFFYWNRVIMLVMRYVASAGFRWSPVIRNTVSYGSFSILWVIAGLNRPYLHFCRPHSFRLGCGHRLLKLSNWVFEQFLATELSVMVIFGPLSQRVLASEPRQQDLFGWRSLHWIFRLIFLPKKSFIFYWVHCIICGECLTYCKQHRYYKAHWSVGHFWARLEVRICC